MTDFYEIARSIVKRWHVDAITKQKLPDQLLAKRIAAALYKAVADERELCAKIAEQSTIIPHAIKRDADQGFVAATAQIQIAAAIRSGGK